MVDYLSVCLSVFVYLFACLSIYLAIFIALSLPLQPKVYCLKKLCLFAQFGMNTTIAFKILSL